MHGTNVKIIGHKQLRIFQATRENQISYKQIAYVRCLHFGISPGSLWLRSSLIPNHETLIDDSLSPN